MLYTYSAFMPMKIISRRSAKKLDCTYFYNLRFLISGYTSKGVPISNMTFRKIITPQGVKYYLCSPVKSTTYKMGVVILFFFFTESD